MSELKAISNINTNEWTFDLINLDYHYVHLFIGFSNGEENVIFDNLSFGYELISENGIVTNEYPKNGVMYHETNQSYLTCDTLYLTEDTQYTLNVWNVNSNQRNEGSYQFKTNKKPIYIPPVDLGYSGTTE